MAQTIQTNIVINAKTGSGFSQVGATLTELGTLVNGVSQELINFGKDSINVYRDYEKSMKDAEVALSTTYGRGTRELSDVMNALDVSATEWAATTIFHTNDVANAISEMAHAGWDADKILAGMPAAMELAQAGSLDLSEAVNYIVKSTNSLGIDSVDDIGNFIDIWAFAANSSASTIGEFGDAMLRMGSTMRFVSDPEELMTLIAVTANAGQTGSEAGTLIRNSMMRLVAPTKKAKEAMAELGATSLEAEGLMEDQALAAANARLEMSGFSAFDDSGNLKDVLDIYRELYLSLGEVAGGFDNIEKNQDALSILSSIFPTRTITEALTLLRGAAEGYDGLYEAMKGGDASDYGEYAAETMMDSLYGKTETFESKVERLKQAVGEELAPQLESVMEGIGGIVDDIANMDEGKFSALVSGLEVIAGAGPALLLAGGAFRLIGTLLTPAGGIGLGLIALASAAAAIKELKDADFADNFGNMEIDSAGIQSYVQSIGEDFRNAYADVDSFRQALDDSVTSYETASSTFSSKLFSDMLENTKLTDTDKEQLTNLGNDMYMAVQQAITNSAAASMSYWQTLFGGEGEAEVDPAYQELIDATNQAYEDAMANASSISEEMHNALMEAFSDGEISQDDYGKIMSYMRSYNAAIAEAAAEARREEDYVTMQNWLRKAQTASWDDLKTIAKDVEGKRDDILSKQEEDYYNERYRGEYEGVSAETLAAADEKFRSQQMETKSAYDEFLTTLWSSQLEQNGLSAQYESLEKFAEQYMSGTLSADTIESILTDQMGKSVYAGQSHLDSLWNTTDREALGKMMGYMINSYGGQSGIEESINWYREQGNTEMANTLSKYYTMEQLINGFGISRVAGDNWWEQLGDDFATSNQEQYLPDQTNRASFEQTVQPDTSAYSVETARTTVEAMGTGDNTLSNLFDTIRKELSGENFGTELNAALMGAAYDKVAGPELQNMYNQLSQSYDLEKVLQDTIQYAPYQEWGEQGSAMREPYAMYQLMYGEASANAEEYKITVTPEVDWSILPEADPIPVPIEPHVEGEDSLDALEQQGVQVAVDGDTTALQATINKEDGANLLSYVDGDTGNLHMKIMDEDGQTLSEYVYADVSAAQRAIDSLKNQVITVSVQTTGAKFASGGRATTASIFGEAGPEWAIPEEHSERTAELLNAAREASGFTWPDLLSRYGGLNSNVNHQPATIIYSPTINAADASGVEQVLMADKERLDRWYEEKKMRDEVEVYA